MAAPIKSGRECVMEEHVVYQPYKISPFDWQVDSIRGEADKKIVTVVIGKKLTKNSKGEILKEEPVREDIYQDILLGIFTEKSVYTVKVRCGKTPGLFISYGGEMILHNDHIKKDMETLTKYLAGINADTAIDAMISGVLNEIQEKKFTPDFLKLVNMVCRELKKEYPAEMVVEAIKHIYLDAKRDLSLPAAKDMRYMTGEELMQAAGKVIKGRVHGTFDEDFEAALLDELLYRFLEGRLKEI